jgi:uncharacterized protein (TIGR02246 family)
MYRPYTSPAVNIPSSPDVESTIRGLTQDFCTAFNTGNYDQVATLFAPDGAFMAPHHEAVSGPKAIERQLREFGDLGYQDLRIDTVRVDCSGDMAMEIGRYTVSIRRENGVKNVDRGKYVKVWRRLGAWRMTADCWSTNLPASVQQEDKSLPVTDKIAIIGNDVPKSA